MQPDIQTIIEKWSRGQSFDQKIVTLFEKVRDIPYGSIGSREFMDVYKQNKGTCSGKHELLKAIYKELGVPTKDFIVMHHFKKLPIIFPDEIQKILSRTDFADPHNFLKILIEDKWLIVDVTWDKSLKKLGFPVNEELDGRSSMKLAVVPEGNAYETDNPIVQKSILVAEFPEQSQKDRKLFLKRCTEWLDKLRLKGEI